jgi:hypothetical protein|tara:strand:- start:628 stop:918 length:291 start_codon:yes stop_codon:yes gene_type:complete
VVSSKERQIINVAIEKANWNEAKTFRGFAPHEYIRNWEDQECYDCIFKYIEKYGVIEEWKYGKKFKYFYHGEYKYWAIPTNDVDPNTIILNRAKVR